jgi:hypothetical protein
MAGDSQRLSFVLKVFRQIVRYFKGERRIVDSAPNRNNLVPNNMRQIGSGGVVESDYRYYQRRAACEQAAAMRAITPEARERRLQLADSYAAKARQCADTSQMALALQPIRSSPSLDIMCRRASIAA